MRSFEQILNEIKTVNESIHWMVGIIPSPSEWQEVQLSPIIGHKTYRIKILDKWYVMPDSKIEWFKSNVGNEFKFQYDKENSEIMKAELVTNYQTNEAINSTDLKNILMTYTKWLDDEGYIEGGISYNHSEDAVNRFMNK